MKNRQNSVDTVLIVEDDESIRETMRDALEHEGYTVRTATNGKEGLANLKLHPTPCLVLLDMMMPIMGGREFLDAVKLDAALAPIPVLIISSVVDKTNSQGAVGFIKKPADLDLVLKMVSQYCSLSKNQ